MKLALNDVPRRFTVGNTQINDYGKMILEPWAMVSIQPESGENCDITATEWGFYLGSSLNSRMKNEGFKVALVKNPDGKIFLNAVMVEKVDMFVEYLQAQNSTVLMWVDEE